MLKKELLNNGYEYGFYLDGVNYKPDAAKGYDEEFARVLLDDARIQDPSDTTRERIGAWIDIAVLIRTMRADRGVSSKIWLLHYTQRNAFHAILTFEAEGGVVDLKLTPQSRKPYRRTSGIYAFKMRVETSRFSGFRKNKPPRDR